ncbi:MAG: hypothetical protein ACXWP0_01160 [Ktedonobacterales bacterium]
MLSSNVHGMGCKVADARLNMDHVKQMLAALPDDAVIDVADVMSCVGQRALLVMAPDAVEASFFIDQGAVTYADGTRVVVRADVQVENMIINLLDRADERDGREREDAPFTVAEIRQAADDWS